MSAGPWKVSLTSRVAAVLDAATQPLSLVEIARLADVSPEVASNSLAYLVNTERAKRFGSRNRFRYCRPDMTPQEPQAETWPEDVRRELPRVSAALPTDRSLRPHVGVVILLDQQRRAA